MADGMNGKHGRVCKKVGASGVYDEENELGMYVESRLNIRTDSRRKYR